VLAAEQVGKGPPVVLVHGFTQTRHTWLPVATLMSALSTFTLVDAPGHGGSGRVRADLREGAALLGATGGRAAYAGYSMGGRLCLHLALARPDLVERLVLISSSAGIEDQAQRVARLAADDVLARRIEAEGVAAFVDWWLAQPLFATLPAAAADREGRLTNTAAGLASSLRLAGAGSQEAVWDRLSELAMPTLVVAGDLDLQYAEIGRRMAARIGDNAELVLIPNAGHACHMERLDHFCVLLADFLHENQREH
jgi:2-succinyl-6-hydroxy-2,4-cyclohexadiene-1-carboxylate synthase